MQNAFDVNLYLRKHMETPKIVNSDWIIDVILLGYNPSFFTQIRLCL